MYNSKLHNLEYNFFCCKLVKAKLSYVTQKREKIRERVGLILILVPSLEGGTVTRRISYFDSSYLRNLTPEGRTELFLKCEHD
jgi:hypothetical protein